MAPNIVNGLNAAELFTLQTARSMSCQSHHSLKIKDIWALGLRTKVRSHRALPGSEDERVGGWPGGSVQGASPGNLLSVLLIVPHSGRLLCIKRSWVGFLLLAARSTLPGMDFEALKERGGGTSVCRNTANDEEPSMAVHSAGWHGWCVCTRALACVCARMACDPQEEPWSHTPSCLQPASVLRKTRWTRSRSNTELITGLSPQRMQARWDRWPHHGVCVAALGA